MNQGHKIDSNNNKMFVDKNINKNIDKEVVKCYNTIEAPFLGSTQDVIGTREVYPPVTYAYVDALNLYHHIQNYIERDENPRDASLKYIDLRKLLSLYLSDNGELQKVYFFTSSPNHLSPDKVARYHLYCKVLQKYCKMKDLVTGKCDVRDNIL